MKKLKAAKYTVRQFNQQFATDAECLNYIFEQRYPNGGTCQCGKVDCFYPVTGRRSYACSFCGRQISPTEGTIFHKSSTSLKSWFFAIFLMSSAKNGVSAKELERQLGVTYKTAWRMAHQIRKLMEQGGASFSGIVEADETFIGGKAKNMHAKQRRERITGRGAVNKTAVVGVLERGGEVRASVVEDVTAATLIPNLIEHVSHGTLICTDEAAAYNAVPHVGFVHARVSHSRGEYVRAEVHTNSIEGFWAQLKRSINGTFHHVSAKHLQRYVNEFVFRYNRRDSLLPMFSHLAGRVALQPA